MLYVQDGLDGDAAACSSIRTRLGADGTVALTALEPIDDGRARRVRAVERAAAIARRSSSATSRPASIWPTACDWAKFASIAWAKDGSGFYYTRFPEPGTVPAGDEHYFDAVYFHRLGDPQTATRSSSRSRTERSRLRRPDQRRRPMGRDHRVPGRERRQRDPPARPRAGRQRRSPLFTGFDAAYTSSSRRRRAGCSSARPRRAARPDRRRRSLRRRGATPVEVVPESADKLSAALSSDRRWSRPTCRTPATGCGCSTWRATRPARSRCRRSARSRPRAAGRTTTSMFVGFTSFVYPPASYRYDLDDRAALAPFGRTARPVDPGGLRDDAGLVSVEGRHARVDVPRPPPKDLPRDGERPGAAHRLRRLQHQPDAGLRSGQLRAARAAAASTPSPTCAAAASTARRGTRRACSSASRTCSTTSSPRPSGSSASGYTKPGEARRSRAAATAACSSAAVMVQRPDLFGAVVCRVPRRRHAALSPLHRRPLLDPRVRLGGRPGAVRVSLRVLAVPQREGRHGVPADPDHDGRHRRPRRRPGMAKKFAARLQAARRRRDARS